MEDKEIVNLYWARSEAAITETEKKYGRYCHSIAYQLLYDDEAHKAVEYLSALYGGLLRMEAPTAVTWGDHDIHGRYFRRCAVYDASGDDREDILNYNLCGVQFIPGQDGRLSAIEVQSGFALAGKVGDYLVVSADEGRERLLAEEYIENMPLYDGRFD